MKKLISGILVASMVIGMLMALPFMSFAEEGDLPLLEKQPYINYSGKTDGILTLILNQSYSSADEKLAGDENMRLCVTYGQYELYVNAYSGEVYVKDTATGNILTTNPYDVTAAKASEGARREAMSQLILQYHDPNNSNSKSTTLTSYTDAACHGQITVEPVKNGVRINYILGNMTKRYVLPASIPAKDFAEKFLMNAQKASIDNIRAEITKYTEVTDEIEEILGSYEEFANKPESQSKWSITELYGTYGDGQEFTSWGNHYMFQAWKRDIKQKLSALFPFDDNLQTNVNNAVEAGYENSDYFIIWSAYQFRSAYFSATLDDTLGSHRGGATRDAWGHTLSYSALGMDDEGNELEKSKWDAAYKDTVEYLRAGAYEKEITYENDDMEIVTETFTCYPNACFVLETSLSNTKAANERRFLNHATDFTMADVLEAEATVGYTEPAISNATFRASLEYVLDDAGLTVTMPAKSLVYDETKYAVDYISVLPYFGSGKAQEGGFIFYPDGSGAIIDFDDYPDKASSLNGKVYGQDYAFYSITGKHQQTISLPVFGSVHNVCTYYMTFPRDASGNSKRVQISEKEYRLGQDPNTAYRPSYTLVGKKVYMAIPDNEPEEVTSVWMYNETSGEYVLRDLDFNPPPGNPTYALTNQVKLANENIQANADKPFGVVYSIAEDVKTTGFLAILEEGASLATLYSQVNESGNYSRPFTSVCARFEPRQSDKYSLADVMSGAEATQFSIMAKGQYHGNYSIRYVSLADENTAIALGATSYYPTTYAGMANAYRDYLKREGVLTALDNLREDLPLYIESFGVIQTIEKRLSIPFTVDVALTSFDNIGEMYDELKGEDISNIKFRLTGFANGGLLTPTYPVKLTWESAAGGKHDFKQLIEKLSAEDTGVELFPNFDFLYTTSDKNIKLKKYGARSVDNRYAWHQMYSAVYQTYTARGGIVISSDMLETAFQRFNKKYAKYDLSTLSLEAAAQGLSSNFNEENFIDRETALSNMASFLETVRNSGYDTLLGTGGNAYALRYMDYLLEAPLESSHFSATSYAIPFWGMVMHGSLQYTGKAYNEQANKSESFLRAIESGASLYYLLSYDNTQLLKDTFKSDYYSVSYEITKQSMIADYKQLNDLIGGLQGYTITDHRGVYAERQKSSNEVAAQQDKLQEEFYEQLVSTAQLRVEEMKALLSEYIANLNDSNKSAIYSNSYSSTNETYKKEIQGFVRRHMNAIRIYLGNAYPVDVTDPTAYVSDNQFKLIWNAFREALPTPEYGKKIGVSFDRNGVVSSALEKTYSDVLDATYAERITQYMNEVENTTADIVILIDRIEYESAYKYFTRSDALSQADAYDATWSTVDDHSVVLVTYSDGTNRVRFLLNFNQYGVDIRMDGRVYSLSKYGYQKLD